jgi:hypothetical protein
LFSNVKIFWIGLNAQNIFALSPSSNKVFSTIASWKRYSRGVPNTLAINFFPFIFFPFKIFPIWFFFLFNFFISYWGFFPYCKDEINWCDFFYIVQKLGDDNCFLFQVALNIFLKACLFLHFKNALKNNFIYFKLIFFDVFVLFWCDDIKNKI